MKTRFRLFQLMFSVIILCSLHVPAFNQTPSLIVSYSTSIPASGFHEKKSIEKDPLKTYHPQTYRDVNAGRKISEPGILSTRGARSTKVSAHRAGQTGPKNGNSHTVASTRRRPTSKEPAL